MLDNPPSPNIPLQVMRLVERINGAAAAHLSLGSGGPVRLDRIVEEVCLHAGWSAYTPMAMARWSEIQVDPVVARKLGDHLFQSFYRKGRARHGVFPYVAPPVLFSASLSELRWEWDYLADPYAPRPRSDGHVRTQMWDEALDPISVLQGYLVGEAGVPDELVNHYIQSAFRQTFALEYTEEAKRAVAAACDEFNHAFFGTAYPSRPTLQNTTARTMPVACLFGRIENRLLDLLGDAAAAARFTSALDAFFRFTRLLRRRYRWVTEAEAARLPSDAREAGLPGIDGRPPNDVGTAVRPLEYGHLKVRLFGHITGIAGLNHVFRGGLLPYIDRGRTIFLSGPPGSGKTAMALHLMADLARRGGLAVHFSLEESSDSMRDRVTTFGLEDGRYKILQGLEGLEGAVTEAHGWPGRPGVLALFSLKDAAIHDGFDLLATIASVARIAQGRFTSVGAAIDSVNALEFLTSGADVKAGGALTGRLAERDLIGLLEHFGFLAVLVGELGDQRLEQLPYLADTVMSVGTDTGTQNRVVEVTKSRAQNYHRGPHVFRISDGHGIVLYPSLPALRHTCLRQTRATPSRARVIPAPGPLVTLLRHGGISEKSATLMYGRRGSGKTTLALHMAMEPSRATLAADNSMNDGGCGLRQPTGILVVTFATPEGRFRRRLEEQPALHAAWNRFAFRRVRWFTPGNDLTGSQIVREIWRFIEQARRNGTPIERAVFEDLEVASALLPALRTDPLFWPTVLDVMSTQAITTFFVMDEPERAEEFRPLESEMDYCLSFTMGAPDETQIVVSRREGRWEETNSISLSVTERGELVEWEPTAPAQEPRHTSRPLIPPVG